MTHQLLLSRAAPHRRHHHLPLQLIPGATPEMVAQLGRRTRSTSIGTRSCTTTTTTTCPSPPNLIMVMVMVVVVIRSPPTKKQQPATALDQDLRTNRLPELDALADHGLERPRDGRRVRVVLQHLEDAHARSVAADAEELGRRVRVERHVELEALLLLAATATAITVSVAVAIWRPAHPRCRLPLNDGRWGELLAC